jgi:uncharacterized protein
MVIARVEPMSLASVPIDSISDEGLHLEATVSAEALTLGPDDLRLDGDLLLEVDLDKVDNGIQVSGLMTGTAIRECVRCLKEFDGPLEVPIAVSYQCLPKAKGGQGRKSPVVEEKATDLEEGDLAGDVYLCQGEKLDLSEMLREQVLLDVPMHPLCNESCQGLCQRCGLDLNQGLCRCPAEVPKGPFSVLVKLRGSVEPPKERG